MSNVTFIHFSKFSILVLLALRSSQTLPEDPMSTLRDYFGTLKSAEWDEVTGLEEEIKKMNDENVALLQEIEHLKEEKVRIIELKEQRELEEQQRLAEEEAKKTKKGGKK